MIEYAILGGDGRDLGHDLRHGFCGPVERMRVLIPFTNELFDLGLERLLRVKLSDPQAFALEDAEPRLDLVHPGAGHRREVKDQAEVLGEPLADCLAVVRTDMIAHEMNRLDRGDNLRVQLFQKGDEFLLTLTGGTVPKDGARTGIECRK